MLHSILGVLLLIIMCARSTAIKIKAHEKKNVAIRRAKIKNEMRRTYTYYETDEIKLCVREYIRICDEILYKSAYTRHDTILYDTIRYDTHPVNIIIIRLCTT